jgi:DNA-binding beta-propeller fold protein YncE/mono/diheme cytochrome c family protein
VFRFPLLLLFFTISADIFAADILGPVSVITDKNSITENSGTEVLYVLEREAKRIAKISLEGKTAPQYLPLPFVPEKMRLSSTGKELLVTGGGADGHLLLCDKDNFKITALIKVAHSPVDAIDYSGSDGTANVPVKFPIKYYAANRFDGTVSVIENNKEVRRIPAGREPIALTITPDGKTLIVANHLPEDASTQYDISSRVRFIDTETGKTDSLRLDVGAMNLRDILLFDKYVFITGNIGHFQQMPNSVTGGWMNENILFAVDIKQREVITSFRLDDYAVGTANPWSIAVSDDKRFLVIAAAGSADIEILDLSQFTAMLDYFAGYSKVQQNTQTTLPMKMRIPVGLKGVRSAVMLNGNIYGASYFEDALIKITPHFTEPSGFISGVLPHDILEIPRKNAAELRSDTSSSIRNNTGTMRSKQSAAKQNKRNNVSNFQPDKPLNFIPLPSFSLASGIIFERSFARLGTEPQWTKERYGEVVFFDATLCLEHWQSCGTCHPDGRSDTLNWDLLNDGQDNHKNTKSLLLSHETPPSMAHGVRRDAQTAVRKGFETILMLPVSENEADAVDDYLKSLQPIPSPLLVNGELSESAQRGKKIFNSSSSGCSVCHPEPYFTDMLLHDVNTRSPFDNSSLFDTPVLKEVWRTSPYLHDGRYTTIRQLLIEGRHADSDRIGRLSEQELDDLVEYVLSL